MRPRAFVRRGVGAISRRLDRPELLSALYPNVRQAEQEAIGIAAALVAALAPDATYVDVGCNRGQVLADAARISPRGAHVAFEPIPELAQEIRERFPGVDCRAKALSSQPGTAQFCHFRELAGWSGLRRNPQISDERGRPQYIDVEVSTLDAEVLDPAPAVVKIDVEGAELAVLEGARKLLSDVRPLVVFEHVAAAAALYEASSRDVWRLLADAGYEVFTATGLGPIDEAAFAAPGHVVNWIARPKPSGSA